jgi:hypothetical protein
MAVSNGPQLGIMIDAAAGDAHPNDFRKALRALDALLFFSAKSMTIAAQPGSPADGDRYIMPGGQTGTDWAGKAAGVIAIYTTHNTVTTGGSETTTSIWEFYTPKKNWVAFVEDASDAFIRYTGTAWTGAFRAANGLELPSGQALKVDALQVLSARKTGWTAPTGTALRTGFDTSTATLTQVAQTLKALIDDLHSTAGHGTIGT